MKQLFFGRISRVSAENPLQQGGIFPEPPRVMNDPLGYDSYVFRNPPFSGKIGNMASFFQHHPLAFQLGNLDYTDAAGTQNLKRTLESTLNIC